MSNPPSVPAPNPYFSGIIYNPSDYISVSGDSALTYSQAIALFIQKTISDSVTGVTNFVNGLTTSSVLAKTISATCNLWTNATGEINIGTLGGRSALIHIGDGDNNLSGSGVHINNGLNTASNVQILNGTGSTGTINLGSATSTTNCNCPLRLIYSPTNLTATNQLGYSTFDTITNTTALPSGTTSSVFTSNVSLPTGVWLITYSIRIQSVAVMNGIALNLYGVDNINGVNLCYGQTNLTPSATTSIGGTGTFVIKSGVGGVNVYNINCYVAYTTGSPSILTTGSFQSNVQRTRIG